MDKPIRVTIDNFTRAETHTYFTRHMQDTGGIGCFKHIFTPTQVDYQPVQRTRRRVEIDKDDYTGWASNLKL